MGLLFKNLVNIFELIYNEAEKEYLDETPYKEMLNEIYSLLENGEITDEEYEGRETEILDKLREIRNYKRESVSEERDENG